MDPIRPQSSGSRQTLAVWLVLAVAVACAVTLLRVDSSRDSSPPLQVKSSRSATVTPARTLQPVTPAVKTPALIRVNVTPGGVKSLLLQIRGPYTFKEVGSAKEVSHGEVLAPSKVEATATGIKIGDATFRLTELEIVPKQDPGIEVDHHLYRGLIRLFRRKDGLISAVNVLPLDDYLASVVDSEMPAAFPTAAREAQAIVSRTYALYHKAHADPAAVYDLFSSQRSQKYLGAEYTAADGRRLTGESDSSRRAVAQTKGLVCSYHGQLFCTYYSAVCGGRTTSGTELFEDAAPSLKSVPCEWCKPSQYYRWTAQLDRHDFLSKIEPGRSLRDMASIKQITGPGDGSISRFRILDGRKSFEVSGVELRERFPSTTLRSPHFTLTLDKNSIRAEGRGHGHGVGFCQWGARGQALAGRTATNIVRYYYPGADVIVDDRTN